MYSEHLITPHPNKAHGVASQALLETICPQDMRLGLEVLRDSGASAQEIDEYVFQTADSLSKAVYESLWFKYDPDAPPPITEAYIAETQVTSCFGYAIPLSECLEEAGIDHWIAFANNHAFTVIPNDVRNRAWLINPSQPELNGEISMNGLSGTLEDIEQQIRKEEKASTILYTDHYIKDAGKGDFCEVVSMPAGGWLTLESDDAIVSQRGNARGEGFQKQKNMFYKRRLITALYRPERGRSVLEKFGLFQHYAAHGNYDSARDHLLALGDLYPEIDTRSKQKHLEKTIGGLISRGSLGDAMAVIDSITGSILNQTNDNRINIWRGDLYKKLGMACGRSEVLEAASDLYETARTPTNSIMIDRKRDKLKLLH